MGTISDSAYADSAARTAGEAMTITAGAEWTIRTDLRVHANAPASNLGSLSSYTITEGKIIWDSTAVRWLAYNTGTGNVPAIGTSITQGGVSGYLLGVWASKTTAQTAVAAAMPVTGFIKFREVTGGAYAAGALTGIGASATGADVQGWISLPHDAASNFIVPRLGEHRARGGRFFLEDTSGAVGQIFQVPTDGSAVMYAPGLWIETGVASGYYEYWPGLLTTCGWAHQHIGEAQGSSDARQKFVKIIAGGQLQMGEAYTQASTYASLAAQASTYVALAYSASYIWVNNSIEVYFASGHLLEVGQTTGLDFTSGSGVDGIYTVVEVLSPYAFKVDAAGSGTAGAVTIRPGVTVTFTAHAQNIGESVYLDATTGTLPDGTYEIYAVPSTSTYLIKHAHTAAITSGAASAIHTLTVTFTANNLAIGSKVYLDFTSGTGVDGEYTVKTIVDANNYRVNFPHTPITSGNVTMRRQIGLVVEAGRRTWIPSNILNEVATGARATNTVPNATIATRPEWTTTSAGAIDLEYVYGCSGYPNINQPFSVRLHNCCFFDSLVITECATALDIEETHTSMQGALDVITLTLTSNFAGGLIKTGRFERGNTPGSLDHCTSIMYCKGLTLDGVQSGIIQYVRNSGFPIVATYCSDMVFSNCRSINGPLSVATCTDLTVTNHDHCERYTGRTNITALIYAITVGGGSNNIKVDGVAFGFNGTIQDCHPSNGIFHTTGSQNIKLRNCGTLDTPLIGGTWAINAYGMYSIIATGGNNDTIKYQRCYVDKVRTVPFGNINSDKNILYESMHGGLYGWSSKGILGVFHSDLNSQIKGNKEVHYITGQASVYGTHFIDFFMGTGYGRFVLNMNEPTSETASIFTMNSGTAKWNSAGGILLAAVGNQATWTDNIFRLGHTGFAIEEALLSGPTQTRFDIHYQIDTGSGFSAWHNLYYQKAGGVGTSGQFTFTVTDATGIEVGDYIWGTGRVNIGRVTQINTNTITSDVANSATVSGVIRFNHLPFETISPSVGYKLKFRLTVITTETVACTTLRVGTTTSVAAQGNLYPLDTITMTINGIVPGSDVVIYAAGTTTVLDAVDQCLASSWSYVYETPQNIDIGVFKSGYVPFYIRNLALTSSNASVPTAQFPDRNYS